MEGNQNNSKETNIRLSEEGRIALDNEGTYISDRILEEIRQEEKEYEEEWIEAARRIAAREISRAPCTKIGLFLALITAMETKHHLDPLEWLPWEIPPLLSAINLIMRMKKRKSLVKIACDSNKTNLHKE